MPDPAVDTPAPPPDVVVAGRFDERHGYGVHRSTGARNWLLTATLAGEGHFQQGGAALVAGPGDVVLLGPEVEHTYSAGDRWHFWWAHFQLRPTWQPRLLPHQVGPRFYVIRGLPEHVWDRILATFGQLHADARWSGHEPPPLSAAASPASAGSAISRDLALLGVETVLLLALAGGDPTDHRDPRVARAQARMIADPAAPHTVASLAADVALSPSRFAHLFTAQTGEPPMQALYSSRLKHAARLLEATDLDIGRVAHASGFASAFHFSRSFRARFGMPPSEYRRHS